MNILNHWLYAFKNKELGKNPEELFKNGVALARKTNLLSDSEINYETNIVNSSGSVARKSQFNLGFLSEIIQVSPLSLLGHEKVFAEHRKQVKAATYIYLLNNMHTNGDNPERDECINKICQEVVGIRLKFNGQEDLANIYALPAKNVISIMKAVVSDIAFRLELNYKELPGIANEEELKLQVIRISDNDVSVSVTHSCLIDNALNKTISLSKSIDLRVNTSNVTLDREQYFGFMPEVKKFKPSM